MRYKGKTVFFKNDTSNVLAPVEACVLGSENLKSFLVNYCRPFIFSTATTFHSFAAIRVAYQLFPEMKNEREKLSRNIKHFSELSIINCAQHLSYSIYSRQRK